MWSRMRVISVIVGFSVLGISPGAIAAAHFDPGHIPGAAVLERVADQVLKDLAEEHQGTPWEILAKRESLTALGLEWQLSRDR